MAATDTLNAQLSNLIQRLRLVTDGMERRWKGSADETVNNGTQDLLTEAGLIKKALEDVDGAVGGAITEVLTARDEVLAAAGTATAVRRGTRAEVDDFITSVNSSGTAADFIGKTAVALTDESNDSFATEYPIINDGLGNAELDVAHRKR